MQLKFSEGTTARYMIRQNLVGLFAADLNVENPECKERDPAAGKEVEDRGW
jgi:hypothetical protein